MIEYIIALVIMYLVALWHYDDNPYEDDEDRYHE